jgi:hypothetical protein
MQGTWKGTDGRNFGIFCERNPGQKVIWERNEDFLL